MTMDDAIAGAVNLPARAIPLPMTISEEAREFLSNPMFSQEPIVPELDDIEGWRAHAARSNAGLSAMMKMQAAAFDYSYEVHCLSHCDLYEIIPRLIEAEDKAMLNIHGGAFIVGGGEAALHAAVKLADQAGVRTFSVDYRMPPDHPFPAGLQDCVEAYQFMLGRYKAQGIAIYGGSAGANLVAAMVLKARDQGLPIPAACVMHSPVSDLRQVGDSFTTNAELDVILKRPADWMPALYSGGHDLMDPLLSPLFGDFTKGFPPSLFTSGTRDLLLSDTVRLHRALRAAGVRAELHVWEAMCHGMAHNAPEAREILDEHIGFVRRELGIA
jgi:acetyl esterase/lipase